jgi:hypothetical protein
MSPDIESLLTVEEQQALLKWRANTNLRPIPVANALQLYQLYLNGYSCKDIYRLNDESLPLGSIVDARIRHEWDRRKDEHLKQLYDTISDKVLKTQMESAAFLADSLSAAHVEHGTKFKKYLQTHNPEFIEQIGIHSLKEYRETLNALTNLVNKQTAKIEKESPAVKELPVKEQPVELDNEAALKLLESLENK